MSKKLSAAIAVCLMLAIAGPSPSAVAGMPVAVDGQPLPTLAPMIKLVAPAVVNIATEGRVRVRQNPLLNDPFFRRFFNLPTVERERRVQSVGSGVIVDAANGFVLTNNHVIANADKIVVTLRDRRQFEAELIGTDPDTDIAVLRIPAEDLTALRLGDSDALEVGDFVVAIGNPFGIGQTVTSGIVSAIRRSGLGIEGYEDFIQTDASINPGNSGGALVTLRGELIGINTAIIGPSGGNVGIGFAIPIDMAQQIMAQLVTYGEVHRGLLGVNAQDLTPDIAEALGIDIRHGAIVSRVGDNSPAARAGLASGDIITAIGGEVIYGASDVRTKIGLLRVGDRVEITVLRDGAVLTLMAEVAEPKAESLKGQGTAKRLSGLTVAPLTDESPLYGRVEGVLVVKVKKSSSAWRTGLRKGDVIFEVNNQPTPTIAAFREAVSIEQRKLVVKLRRGNAQMFIVVR
ncbi:MAG: DegQ family serine endoprotease [Alphaproteobacteria bacterium]